MDELEEIFSNIYDSNIDKIFRFIFLKVSSPEVAEDLCSETFIRGWKAFQKQNPNKIENPSAFLYKIARNLVVDFYRKNGQRKVVFTEYRDVTDPKVDLEKMAILNSDIDGIRRTLIGVKQEYQDVIIWHYLDELSIPEIAKIVDKSENAVRVTLHRALKSLRTKLS